MLQCGLKFFVSKKVHSVTNIEIIAIFLTKGNSYPHLLDAYVDKKLYIFNFNHDIHFTFFVSKIMKNHNPTVLLSEYRILSGSLERLNFGNKCIVNTVNQYSFAIAENNAEFKIALLNSDVLLPDGVSITTAIKLLSNQSVKKVAGADMHGFLLNKLNQNNGRCFYFGSTFQTLSLIKKRLSVEYPNIKMAFYSPPFKKDFTIKENRKMINLINKFNPEVLFVGMTAPKQEKWTYQNKVVLNAKIICTIGAVFDFYAKTVNRPSLFWRNLGLEWFIRLVKEPRRMFKRYLFYGPIFIFQIAKIKFKILLKLIQKNIFK